MKKMWEIKQSANQNAIDMHIYGDVQRDYFDWLKFDVVESETSANYFRQELAKYPDVSQINIYINSCGGSVFEGEAIYNQLKRHPAQKNVYIDGYACSVAATIAMCGDKVVMPKNTKMFIHEAWNVAAGNPTQLRKAADDLDVINEGNRQAYLQKSNGKIAEQKLIELLRAETWLTAEQCIEYGFADEYAENDVDMAQAKSMLEQVNQSLEQHVKYHTSIAEQFKQLISEKEVIENQQAQQENKLQKLFAALTR